jgi:hypothetical protein
VIYVCDSASKRALTASGEERCRHLLISNFQEVTESFPEAPIVEGGPVGFSTGGTRRDWFPRGPGRQVSARPKPMVAGGRVLGKDGRRLAARDSGAN